MTYFHSAIVKRFMKYPTLFVISCDGHYNPDRYIANCYLSPKYIDDHICSVMFLFPSAPLAHHMSIS